MSSACRIKQQGLVYSVNAKSFRATLTQRLRGKDLLDPMCLQLRQGARLVQRKDLCDQTRFLPCGHNALPLRDSGSSLQRVDVAAASPQPLQYLQYKPLPFLRCEQRCAAHISSQLLETMALAGGEFTQSAAQIRPQSLWQASFFRRFKKPARTKEITR